MKNLRSLGFHYEFGFLNQGMWWSVSNKFSFNKNSIVLFIPLNFRKLLLALRSPLSMAFLVWVGDGLL